MAPLLPPVSAARPVMTTNKAASSIEIVPRRVPVFLGGTPFRFHWLHCFRQLAPIKRVALPYTTRNKTLCSMTNSGLVLISNNTSSSAEIVPRTGSEDFRGTVLLPMVPLLPPSSARQRPLCPTENPTKQHRRTKLFTEGLHGFSGNACVSSGPIVFPHCYRQEESHCPITKKNKQTISSIRASPQ